MTINLDRGLNDLEDSIDRLIKQKEYLQKQLRKTKDRSEEIMALYAEVKRLKNENEILQTNLHKMKTLHNAKVLDERFVNDLANNTPHSKMGSCQCPALPTRDRQPSHPSCSRQQAGQTDNNRMMS